MPLLVLNVNRGPFNEGEVVEDGLNRFAISIAI